MSENEFNRIDKFLPGKTKEVGAFHKSMQVQNDTGKNTTQKAEHSASFSHIYANYLAELGDTHAISGQQPREGANIRKAMEEAEKTFETMMQIREEIDRAFKELMQLQS
jgi:flagellar hook-basal body complex protein FliE